jgi:hypothetical protein
LFLAAAEPVPEMAFALTLTVVVACEFLWQIELLQLGKKTWKH